MRSLQGTGQAQEERCAEAPVHPAAGAGAPVTNARREQLQTHMGGAARKAAASTPSGQPHSLLEGVHPPKLVADGLAGG